jgi:DNA-directed RNA polymerase subunit RPC12/RpoP
MEEKIQSKQNSQHRLCFRCGRKLKSDESKERGMGPTCWKKYQEEQSTQPLF